MKFESWDYNLETKRLELFSAEGELVEEINPVKVIKENIESKACYLIPNQSDFLVFDRSGRDIANVTIEEVLSVWESKTLEKQFYQKYLGE